MPNSPVELTSEALDTLVAYGKLEEMGFWLPTNTGHAAKLLAAGLIVARAASAAPDGKTAALTAKGRAFYTMMVGNHG